MDIETAEDWATLDTAEGRAAVAGESAWIDYLDQDETGRESRTYRIVRDVELDIREAE